MIISVDNEATLGDADGHTVSRIELDAGDESYEYIFSCQILNYGVTILNISLEGDFPKSEKGVIYRIPWFNLIIRANKRISPDPAFAGFFSVRKNYGSH